jgi:sigma-E factor negative regulatory protein RseB
MRRGLAAAALSLVACAAPQVHAAAPNAAQWLERMTEALATLNYDGLFTHTAGQQSETMRIVHRVEGGRSMERLVSLDGSGREIVRTAEEVHFYMPDRRVVLVEPRGDEGSLLRALPAPGPELDELYTLAVRKGSKLLGRDVRVLDILPRDVYRYGYRLWLDEETAMPLRSEVVNGEGRAVEAMHFTQLEVRDRIAARELEPAVDATGYQWVRTRKRGEQQPASVGWRPRKVPPGFRLVATRVQVVPGVPMPVQHLIFSDGFASVSVFIEPGQAKGPTPPESTSVGSSSTFSTQVRGHVVTAIGEVPATTVRELATSVVPVEELATPAVPAPDRPDR